MEGKSIGESKQIAASQFIKEREYWTKKIPGDFVLSYFPYDYHAEGIKKQYLKTGNIEISGRVLELIEKITSGSNPKLHIVLTAALTALLYKYSHHKDIIIGTTIDKQETGTEFINTVLALRNQPHDNMTFKELILQVRQTIIEAIENQNYPIEALLNRSGMEGSENEEYSRLFDTALIIENIHDRKYLHAVQPNIVFSFARTGQSIAGRVEYNSRLYKESTIKRIIKHFLYLLQSVLANLDQPLFSISLLTEEEEKALLFDFNDTRAAYPGDKMIHTLFAEQVEKTPGKTAVLDAADGHSLTYRELNQIAHHLACLLKEKGVKNDTIVGILMERSLEFVTAVLGVLKAGAAYLPIDTDYPGERINYMLKDSGTRVLLAGPDIQAEVRAEVEEKFIEIIDISTLLSTPGSSVPASALTLTAASTCQVSPANLAYVIYTSGSTGKPKGVMIDHRSLVNYICWAAKTYVKDETLDFPLYTSISFDLTVTSIFTPLISGQAIIVYRDKEDRGSFLVEEVIDRQEAGIVKLTPSHLKLIKDKPIPPTVPVRRFIVGGEDLETQLAADIDQSFQGKIEIYNEYGPTEATVGCMIYQFDPRENSRKLVPIGVPIDNARIYLLDSRSGPVPVGVTGELYISGDGLARGYLNSPALTAEKFVNNPFAKGERMYRSGDLALWLGNGIIEFAGRIDQQIKIRGHRVDTSEIESLLSKYEDIKAAAVTAREHQNGTKYLCAYVVSEKDIETSKLREYLSHTLPAYMIPEDFVFLPELPLSPNGKLDRQKLPEPGNRANRKGINPFVPPGSETEKKLAEIWSEVLEIDKNTISIDDSFFELGGHSLNAATVTSKIHKELDVRVPLLELFRALTIRELSRYITSEPLDRHINIENTEEKEYYPLSSAQKRLYILQQLDLAGIGYNIPNIFELEGEPDRHRLEEAFKKLIQRHDSFRTTFVTREGEPVQRIHHPSTVAFQMGYFETGSEDVEDTFFDFIQPFDLTQAPLFRVKLVKTGNNQHILMLDMHHIISDGVSAGILIREFIDLYAGEQLLPLRIQYKDFSRWQNRLLSSERTKKQEKYWLQQFNGPVPVLNLPNDFSRSRVQGFAGSEIRFEIDIDKARALKKIALEQDATVYMVLLALYGILLSKICGQQDIVMGTPSAGRGHTDLEQVTGMFVNTLALRFYPAPTKTFIEFLQEVRITTQDSFDNQDLPFEHLVEKLALDRDASRNPLFNVMFTLENLDLPSIDTKGLQLKLYPYTRKIAKFDLHLIGYEKNESLHFVLEYSTRLFKKETIENFTRYFKTIVSSVIHDPDQELSRIQLVSGAEREAIQLQFSHDLEEE